MVSSRSQTDGEYCLTPPTSSVTLTEKTRALLFQGANPSSRTNGCNGYTLNGHTPNGHSHTTPNGYSHLRNGAQNGHSSCAQNSSDQAAGKQATVKVVVDVCACCHKKLVVAVPCGSCSRTVCGSCLQGCCVCQERFCQFCSVLKYVHVCGGDHIILASS